MTSAVTEASINGLLAIARRTCGQFAVRRAKRVTTRTDIELIGMMITAIASAMTATPGGANSFSAIANAMNPFQRSAV
jgi:hypothetical protein